MTFKKEKFRPLTGTIVLDIKADFVGLKTRYQLRRNTASVGMETGGADYQTQSVVVGPEGYAVQAATKLLLIDTPSPIEAAIGGTTMHIDRQFLIAGSFPQLVLFATEQTRVNVVVC